MPGSTTIARPTANMPNLNLTRTRGNTAPAPLVGLHRQPVVVLVGKAEDLFAAIAILCGDDPAHLMGARIAAVPDVLKRDARRDAERSAQIAGLLRAEVKDLLCGFIVRYDSRAASKAPELQMILDEVEAGGIDLFDIDAQRPLRIFEQEFVSPKLRHFLAR